MRVVVVSHAHPDFSRGGGEISAWNLYKGINSQRQHQAWFLARAAQGLLNNGTALALHRDHEYLFAGNAQIETLTATAKLGPDAEIASLLRQLKPDVIHFHHYMHVGIELIRVAKMACPKAKLVLTLHEFIAICMNDGMMVKKDKSLCYHYSPRECANCYPDKGPDFFFLREHYIKSFFALIDTFIAPSHFLAQRYIDWGLPADKMLVLENGIKAGSKLPVRKLGTGEARTRFAYFGQAHPFKGLDLILEAFGALPPKIKRTISLDIHAHGLDLIEKDDYHKKVSMLLKKHQDFAHFHGGYDQNELPRLMQETDWVIMGSTWWENSPLVIQEAYKFGRPVICPDLGGMGEKVQHNKGGLLYRARDAVALTQLVQEVASAPDDKHYQRLLNSLPNYTSIDAAVKLHLRHYR